MTQIVQRAVVVLAAAGLSLVWLAPGASAVEQTTCIKVQGQTVICVDI